ncbi:uncharacterized protein DUF370 [Scopulibacillus darangshiensis]|uniref:Uncharacterized protein DUF370 n=1 Tax=Scopulibacillus darangshiensis TaxID=442528 RepID=A0A4R2NLC7_9BACL|nr:extracellular matrix/biofilm biosynthesis regulator RemA family protein [Scopulibacillus darangshiensis]TCP22148.1 uncharacterized protein DUF370 [Scopulibacillus darangshiensis]
MFIHLGEDIIIRSTEVIAIFDYERMKEDLGNQTLLMTLEDKKVMHDIGQQMTKSVVFTDGGIYLSPFSPATLKRRSQSAMNLA